MTLSPGKQARNDYMDDSEMAESTDCEPEKRPVHHSTSEALVSSKRQPIAISLVSDLWIVISIVTFIADVGSDLLVSAQYYNQNHVWYFGITLGLALTASLVLQIFSAKWFCDDGKKTCKVYVLHFVQMGPLLRYWSAVKLCWKSRRGRVAGAQELLIPKWRDLCMLRLLQAFIQSAPQAVFQLFVLCRKATFVLEDDLIVALAAITSLISVVWSLVCYSKALRDLRDNAQDLPLLGFTFQFSWRACMLTSRVLALVLFASHFQQWMLVAAVCHWLLMALWLTCQRTQFCVDENGQAHPCKEKMFNAVIAFIYIFCFFNTKEGMTRKRIVLFYSVMLVENSLLISMWYPNRTLNMTLTYASMGVVWGGFISGIVFMILYYRFYHHSHPFKGLFLRTRTFNIQGSKMYGLYFCCCCRIKQWEVAIYDCSDNNAGQGLDQGLLQGAEALNPNPRDSPYLHWDNEDIQMSPLNGLCVRGRDNDPDRTVLIQHPLGPSRYEDPDAVPDIIVTAASPLALSPRESLSLLSSEDKEMAANEDDALAHDENPPLSPGQTSLDKAREILASKLNKSIETPTEEGLDEDEDDIPKINYGTVSFGNRYSLVSSDCISISSESSLSSFTNSLNDLLDRMGLASPKNELVEKESKLKASAVTDEGIFSDERDSPIKSSEPSPSHTKENIVNGTRGDTPTPLTTTKDELVNYLETVMDASSPLARKKSPRKGKGHDKDEGSESESTDASSDDRERRYSCDEFFTDFSPTNSCSPRDEGKMKRHSFDIADLSTNYNRVRRKAKNKRRFNKIIIFDNFVASALKPGKFGSLRKSFERLSNIQEESGLLSDESLKNTPDPQSDDQLLLGNKAQNNKEPHFHDDSLATDHRYPNTIASVCDDKILPNSNSDDVSMKLIQQPNDVITPLPRRIVPNTTKSNALDGFLMMNGNEDDKVNLLQNNALENEHIDLNGKMDENIDYSDDHDDKSMDELSAHELVITDLTPSRFSTVKPSLDSVPLACSEDDDDLDDLGSSDDDIKANVGKHPTLLMDLPCQRNMSAESIDDSDSCRDQDNHSIGQSLASSGSSVFENILILDVDQNPSELNKRHTFAFGANRINNVRREKVKRLGTSSSQHALRTPGSPVWVHKAVINHRRRRKPKVIAQMKSSENSESYIQEIRV